MPPAGLASGATLWNSKSRCWTARATSADEPLNKPWRAPSHGATAAIISRHKLESAGVARTIPRGAAARDNQGRSSIMAKDSARKDPRPEVSRRKSLAGVAVAGAATAVIAPAANAATTATSPDAAAPARVPSALPPTWQVAAAETGTPKELPRIGGVPGSDFMVDVIKTLDIKYLPSNCASSFRAIHES